MPEQPDTVHVDTHGQSELVFGLAHLLGIQLMPRMRNWNEMTFYRTSIEASYKHVDALFSRVADWDHPQARWKDLMQVMLSVQAGTVLPSMLLRKLPAQSRQNQLYRDFRELGRVVRTGLLLEYISIAELRRSIHAATTKIKPRAPSPIGSASAIPRGRRNESSTATSPGMRWCYPCGRPDRRTGRPQG